MTAVSVSLTGGQPLTAMQRPLWTSQRRHPAAPVQNMALLTHIDGPVDVERLQSAFDVVRARSDALRTRIVTEDGTAVVRLDAEPQPAVVVPMPVEEARRWAERRVATPLDLTVRGYDSAILPHPDGTASWYLDLHHAITDATASALVFDACAEVYHGGRFEPSSYYRWASDLDQPGEPRSPRARRARRAAAHWRDRPPAPGIDRLYRPLRTPGAAATRLDVDLDPTVRGVLVERLADDFRLVSDDLSWTAALMTATAALLWSVGGADHVTIGLPVHNRGDAEARDVIGPVMEVFPVDVVIEADQTYRQLHRTVTRAIMTTLSNAAPGTAPAADHAAVVNVIARAEVGSFGTIPTRTEWVHSGAIDSAHALRVQFTAYDQQLAIDVNRSAAGDDHLERIPAHFSSILAALANDPDRPLAGPALGDDERAILDRWGTTPEPDPPTEPSLVDWLRTALADRSTVALSDGDQAMTGAELWGRARAAAVHLRRQGVSGGDRVAIEMARSVPTVIAILGVVLAGASFVPIDPAQPARRRRELAERAGVRLVLTGLPPTVLDGGGAEDRPGDPDPMASPAPDDEAYLLFTSGSTGRPKGVPITHRGLGRYLRFAVESYLDVDRSEADLVVPLFSALTFDLTMTSLFLPLLADGELTIVEPDGPAGLAAVAADHRITWCKATPSHLEILARLLPDEHRLSTVVVGGEAFGAGLARRLLDARPGLTIFNEYGPTEAVVGCMIHRVDPERLGDHPEVPIGVPAPGVTLRVVGPTLDRLPVGAAGELLIAHPGITTGYLTDPAPGSDTGADAGSAPDLGTVSVPHGEDVDPPPFVELDGERYYRSGDLVRLADGRPGEPPTLIYLGRLDDQVKVGGIRLEPTEVADALTEHPSIEAAAVRLWSPRPTEPGRRCVRCGLASNVPGIEIDGDDVCSTCRQLDRVAPQVRSWFRTVDDLVAKRDGARRRRRGEYDCLHLLSGGKDSTYALYRLVDLGFQPYVFTLDNGFISSQALDNVARTVDDLGVAHEVATTSAMNEIFRDSLERHSNVCNGCYKTIYTLATTRAVELGIPLIVTGLSRGQLFETRLLPQQFTADRFDPDAIDRAVIEARKAYHRVDDGPNRLLDTTVFADDDLFDRIEYLDFYRYVDVELAELYRYLDERAPWVRPTDTGRSTNCLINAAGIHTHLTEQGYHNYAIPYAWDVRLGHKTRTEAIAELDDDLDGATVEALLAEVGYTPDPIRTLTAWIEVSDGHEPPTPSELRAFLAESLPVHAIPAAFVTVGRLPLTANGKLDPAALPPPRRTHRSGAGIQIAAETELEATIVAIWEEILRVEPIGIDDDFFALGGDSLAALEMGVVVGETAGVTLGDDAAFVHSTPRALAAAVADLIDGAEAGPAHPDGPVDGPVDRGPWSAADPPPPSAGERAIRYEQAARPDEVMYNVGRLYRVGGPVDGDRFVAAVRTVAGRHVPLRWTHGAVRTELPSSDRVEVDRDDRPITEPELDELTRRFHRTPIDLDRGPLLRVLIRSVGDETVILLVCHHASGDAESFEVLWPQIDAAYSGGTAPEPGVDYPSFTAWQAERLDDADRDHWLGRLTPLTPLALPHPSAPGPDGYLTRTASVTPAQLKARPGVSAFAVALAALVATLRRYAEAPADDGADGGDRPARAEGVIGVGMIASGRNHPDADALVGYFLNTLPIELPCALDDELGTLTARAGAAVAANLAHRTYPFAQIVADRRAAGQDATGADVLIVYERMPTTTLGDLPVSQRVLSPGSAVANATIFVEERDDRIGFGLEFRGTFLDPSIAEQLLADLDTMVSRSVAAPSTIVGDVDLPSSAGSVLAGPPLDGPTTLLPAIVHHLRTRGDHPAVVCGDVVETWAGLDDRSRQLADRLRAAGVRPGHRVLVELGRSVDLVAAIVAVLRVGAAYVPVDPTYPSERIRLITDRAGAAARLTAAEPDGVAVIPVEPRPTPVAGRNEAYVIFTSGSTGPPRGVPVTHPQLAASTVARRSVYDGERPEEFVVVSSPSFDSSVVGLFWTLNEGGTIVLPTDAEARDPDGLVELLGRSPSHVLLVPSLYQAVLDRGRDRPGWPRRVIVAGEACPAALARRHHELRPASALTNEYGPTETTVWATAHHVAPTDDPVPIGRPIPGSWVAVVDEWDRPRPEGVVGELIIGGAGLVDGYAADPEATSARFGTGWVGGHRFFRTGDRARIIDGVVHFAGRVDDQLNVGGVRAEPEDIERVILDVASVAAAIVTAQDPRSLAELIDRSEPAELAAAMEAAARTDDPARELTRRLRGEATHARLVAHLEGAPGVTIDLDAVRRRVADGLPPGLRPSIYQLHHRLPRTPNGKLDRRAASELPVAGPGSPVPGPVTAAATGTGGDRAPSGTTDDAGATVADVQQLFATILRQDRVEPDRSFFDLGGHSLLAMELLAAVEDRFGVEVTVPSLHDHPSPVALARFVTARRAGGGQKRFLVPIQPEGSRPPVFAIHVLGVNAEYFRPLAERLGTEQPFYGLGQPTLDLDTSTPTEVAEIADRYRRELEAAAPDGPVVLTAISLGAVVAYELAGQLRAGGRDVAALILFDAAGPSIADSAPTRAERAALHLAELRRNPTAYLGGRFRKYSEDGGRRLEILAVEARRRLGLTLDHDLQIRRFIEANWHAQLTYRYRPYGGSVTVFKAADDPFFTERMVDEGMGWASVVTGPLDVVTSPGRHLTMLAEPHVASLAARFDEVVRATPAQDRATGGAGVGVGVEAVEAELRAAIAAGTVGVAIGRLVARRADLTDDGAGLVDRADRTARDLAGLAAAEGRRLADALTAAGLDPVVEPTPERLPYPIVGVRLPDDRGPGSVTTTVAALAGIGYRPQGPLGSTIAQPGGTGPTIFVAGDDAATRCAVTWGRVAGRQPIDGPAGHQPIDGPIGRRARLRRVADRLRTRGGSSADLGVFLGTPTAMIPELLALADPGADDVVIDVGCGDGRILVEAARRFGCRAAGIETDPDLAAAARDRIDRAGLADRVIVHQLDATAPEARRLLAAATVVFLFLPAETSAGMLPAILDGLAPGGRVVAHEQDDVAWPVAPDASRLVIAGGFTTAHLWQR